jgi:hypothetical protein
VEVRKKNLDTHLGALTIPLHFEVQFGLNDGVASRHPLGPCSPKQVSGIRTWAVPEHILRSSLGLPDMLVVSNVGYKESIAHAGSY